mmetsp:Transcript_5383/g.9911  ORF Transcript_5383/g.9911 Transcript_5383/m.9911 type:complete len:137 (+) Transcript_5383:230-640(+)
MDSGLDEAQTKAVIAALNFILTTAAKYHTDDATLNTELTQLGLPKENSDAIARAYRANVQAMSEVLKASYFALPRVQELNWTANYDIAKKTAEVGLSLEHQSGAFDFRISQNQLALLIHELSRGLEAMEKIDSIDT